MIICNIVKEGNKTIILIIKIMKMILNKFLKLKD